jgi:hypothetical protein
MAARTLGLSPQGQVRVQKDGIGARRSLERTVLLPDFPVLQGITGKFVHLRPETGGICPIQSLDWRSLRAISVFYLPAHPVSLLFDGTGNLFGHNREFNRPIRACYPAEQGRRTDR